MNGLVLEHETMTRRSLFRLLGGGGLALAGLAAPGAKDASASRKWCRSDPIFEVNGKRGHLYLSADEDIHGLVTGPSEVVIRVPSGAGVKFIWADSGFGGYGFNVRFEEDDGLKSTANFDQVEVLATVPAMTNELIRAELVYEHRGDARVQIDQRAGRTNTWLSVRGLM